LFVSFKIDKPYASCRQMNGDAWELFINYISVLYIFVLQLLGIQMTFFRHNITLLYAGGVKLQFVVVLH